MNLCRQFLLVVIMAPVTVSYTEASECNNVLVRRLPESQVNKLKENFCTLWLHRTFYHLVNGEGDGFHRVFL